jgi:hypothetical protein
MPRYASDYTPEQPNPRFCSIGAIPPAIFKYRTISAAKQIAALILSWVRLPRRDRRNLPKIQEWKRILQSSRGNFFVLGTRRGQNQLAAAQRETEQQQNNQDELLRLRGETSALRRQLDKAAKTNRARPAAVVAMNINSSTPQFVIEGRFLTMAA